MQAHREKRLKEADKRFKLEREQEIRHDFLANLHKEDSTRVLLREFEGTLHKADGVHDSPSRNTIDTLIKPEQANDDLFSIRAEQKKTTLEKKLQKENEKDVKIDKKILQMTTKIRAQQNWLVRSSIEQDDIIKDDEAQF